MITRGSRTLGTLDEWKEPDDVASNRNVGAYGSRLFFQTRATYSNPRHSPIDLSKMRR